MFDIQSDEMEGQTEQIAMVRFFHLIIDLDLADKKEFGNQGHRRDRQ